MACDRGQLLVNGPEWILDPEGPKFWVDAICGITTRASALAKLAVLAAAPSDDGEKWLLVALRLAGDAGSDARERGASRLGNSLAAFLAFGAPRP